MFFQRRLFALVKVSLFTTSGRLISAAVQGRARRSRIFGALSCCSLQALVVILLALSTALPSLAATDTVTSLADDGSAGTLRSVIAAAAPGDTINFTVTGTITLASGVLEISQNLTISGPGAANLAISGANASTVFQVDSGVAASMSGVTIFNGYGSTGGGILNNGALTVINSTLSGNSATSYGGGILNNGTLAVINSTLSGNSATTYGGGIFNLGVLTVVNVTLSGNSANYGGGIYADGLDGGTLNVSFTTLSGNSASTLGGAIYFYYTPSATTIKSSILANTSSGGNCYAEGGTVTSAGFNLSDDPSCPFQITDFNNTPAGLDPSGLKNNGGPTPTIALLATSAALDLIPTNACSDVAGNLVTTDQRGITRPQGPACDAGAFELVQVPSANVCPTGQTTPAPCSYTITLQYNTPGTTFGANPVQVVTQGVPNLDFTLASTTCTGSPTSCIVLVTFAPLAPGLRMGAVQLMDNSGNLLNTTFIKGVGQGPAIAFGPGVQTTVGTGLDNPGGVAVDAAGDIFIADYLNAAVLEVPAGGGVQTTVPASGLRNPWGVAVDGAGDVFFADYWNEDVVEIPAGGGVQTTVGSGLSHPAGVAVDGAGDVFIADSGNNRVVEVPAGGGAQTTVGTGLSNDRGVAVDGAGDVFIADTFNNRVVKVPAGGGAQTTVGTGLAVPFGVAVDGVGDVFIADTDNSRVVEVLAGGGGQTTVSVTGLSQPWGVAVDGAGDVFIADTNNNRVVEIQRLQPPTLSFATTPVGSASSDSPQSFTIQNIGNQPLDAVALGLVVTGPNFLQVAGSGTPADCTSSFALTPGASCNLSISFEPQSAGGLSSTATFTDNALNASPSASQSIALQGTGAQVIQSQTITFTISAPPNAPYNSSFSVAAIGGASGNPVVFTSSGVCTNSSGMYTMTSGTGTCSVIANQAGNSNYAPATQVTQYVNATPLSQTILFTVPAPATSKSGDIFTVAATGGASGIPVMFTSSGVCSNSGATYTMASNTGTCMVIANQTGNNNYAAATQVTETVTGVTTVIKVAPTVTFTGAPSSAYYQSTFTVATTQNTGITPTITAAGPCKISGITVTVTSGTGTCTLTAKWATDTYYLAATLTEHTTAEKLASGLSWTSPAPINYGTALAVTELNATANVPGKFFYSPASGKVLTAGTRTLSVTFTPTATADYSSATDTVSLVVNQLDTTTSITSTVPNPSIMGKPVKVSFAVTAAYGKATGTVTVNSSTGESCTGHLSGGIGSCSITFAASGSPTLIATYSGDANNITSVSGGNSQTVNP
jgi:predicted outer membrane repeat protein